MHVYNLDKRKTREIGEEKNMKKINKKERMKLERTKQPYFHR